MSNLIYRAKVHYGHGHSSGSSLEALNWNSWQKINLSCMHTFVFFMMDFTVPIIAYASGTFTTGVAFTADYPERF